MNPKYIFGLVFLGGLLGFGVMSKNLLDQGIRPKKKPNVAALKGSPFGKLFAIAMQGPVEKYHHKGEIHEHSEDCGEDCSKTHESDTDETATSYECQHCKEHASDPNHKHEECLECSYEEFAAKEAEEGHVHGPDCGHDHAEDTKGDAKTKKLNVPELLPIIGKDVRVDAMARLKNAYKIRDFRTNPVPLSAAHDFYLRREFEDKLQYAYELDPANYTNFSSYNMIVKEFQQSTRVKDFTYSFKLSKQTIDYCKTKPDDIFAQLTGAAAAHDAMSIFFFTKEFNRKEEAAYFVGEMEKFMQRFQVVKQEMIDNGRWQKIHPTLKDNIEEAVKLNNKLLEVNKITLERDFRQASLLLKN